MPTIARSDMYKLFVDNHIDEDTYNDYNQLTVCNQCVTDYGLDSDMYPEDDASVTHCPVCGIRLKKEEKQ